jgi:hypothetical protein
MINSDKISNQFREKIKNSVPSDFDLAQIGKIDLKEAEKIAREEVIFLKEEDLIEGLEDFELIPLKEDAIAEEPRPQKFPERAKKIVPETGEDEVVEDIDENIPVFDTVQDSEISEINISGEGLTDSAIPDKLEKEHEQKTEDLPEVELLEEVPEPVQDISIVDLSEAAIESKPADSTRTTESEKIESGLPDAGTVGNVNDAYHQIADITEIDEIFEDEILPDKYDNITKKSNVNFIDDGYISKDRDLSITAEEDLLTTRLSDMIDITRGKSAIVEPNADLFDNRYTLEIQKTGDYDDEKLEEKFLTDSDFDFIDNSIIKEDFVQYIQKIDDYYSTESGHTQSEISKIMGLEHEEKEFFDDILFGKYFKDIDIDSKIEFINPGFDFYTRNVSDTTEAIYLLDDPASLKDDERHSIEADISSDSAIIFEESIRDIESMLGEVPERVVEKKYPGERKVSPVIDEAEPVIFEDITDRVIILDDINNVNEFMETIPGKKEDLTRLLAYLDGLFEKLPEEAVRKFAESEYFDLYVKVLKDMGL